CSSPSCCSRRKESGVWRAAGCNAQEPRRLPPWLAPGRPSGLAETANPRRGSDDPSASPSVLIELDGLTRRYGALVAVDSVNMRIAQGEVHAVIGPNGAGKTTLFHLISGMVGSTSGRVRCAGEDTTGFPAHVMCQRGLSRTFQLTSLFPEMSARENARLGAQARPSQMGRAA